MVFADISEYYFIDNKMEKVTYSHPYFKITITFSPISRFYLMQ